MPSVYLSPVPPVHYICGKCGAVNVKLWRDYMTFLDSLVLHCARCAALAEKADISTIDPLGLRTGDHGTTDQIGNYVPAIPTEDGLSYYGYTSVPPEAIKWWQDLPTLTFPTEKR